MRPMALAHFYERPLGWEMRALNGPRPGMPPGDGWAQILSPDDSLKIEIQFDQHYVRPSWPGVAGAQGMQRHLDFRVEDVPIGVEWAIACGAIQAEHQPPNRDPMRLRVMLSPLRALEITRCTVDCKRTCEYLGHHVADCHGSLNVPVRWFACIRSFASTVRPVSGRCRARRRRAAGRGQPRSHTR